MCDSRSKEIAFGHYEHLRLVLETPERFAMKDSISIAVERITRVAIVHLDVRGLDPRGGGGSAQMHQGARLPCAAV
jgi:hypothetical protein